MKIKYFYLIMLLTILMMIGTSSYFRSLNITLSSPAFVSSIINVMFCFIISYTSYIIDDIWKIKN